jgi:S-ribosylhomocysteine lyase
MADKMNVESFNLDHTKVQAPYIRLADRKELPKGDVVSKFDIRFLQPNQDHLDMKAVHSLEHMFAEHSRNHSNQVLDFSPMGCQTGFYLTMAGEHSLDEIADLVGATLGDIIEADTVPAANEVQCGWGANHSLTAAQEAARAFLVKRAEWGQVYA